MAGTEYSGDESETDIRKRMYANHENHPPAPLWSLEGIFVWNNGILCEKTVCCARGVAIIKK